MNTGLGTDSGAERFFSSEYSFVLGWIKPRLRPTIVANVPMEAFQGFCRAKTNFYVFEKIG